MRIKRNCSVPLQLQQNKRNRWLAPAVLFLGMVGINKKMLKGGPDGFDTVRYEYEKAL